MESRNMHDMMFSPDDFAHLEIPIKKLISVTENFDDKTANHTSESEQIYWGGLLMPGDQWIRIIARRWLNKEQLFWMEIYMLSSLKHKNLVSFVGFCDENDEKVIIYKDEITSLDSYLSESLLLTWVRRLEICLCVANALSYTHFDEPRDFSIIHDIKSAAVLLDDNWEPKLSGFKLSMKVTDPKYFDTDKSAQHKSDMYSFGLVMCELLCGWEAVDNKYLASVVVAHYREKKLNEIIDWDLWNQMDLQSFNIFAELAYDCLSEEHSERPNIHEIVPRLEKALKLQLEHHNAGWLILTVVVNVIRLRWWWWWSTVAGRDGGD